MQISNAEKYFNYQMDSEGNVKSHVPFCVGMEKAVQGKSSLTFEAIVDSTFNEAKKLGGNKYKELGGIRNVQSTLEKNFETLIASCMDEEPLKEAKGNQKRQWSILKDCINLNKSTFIKEFTFFRTVSAAALITATGAATFYILREACSRYQVSKSKTDKLKSLTLGAFGIALSGVGSFGAYQIL